MRSAKVMMVFFVGLLWFLALCGPAWAVEGIISYWRFDEENGTTAYDSVGENHGTIYGAARTTGKIGDALYFDGAEDYVNVPLTGFPTGSAPRTVAAWFKTTVNNSGQQWRAVFGYGDNAYARTFSIAQTGWSYANKLAFGGYMYDCVSDAFINDGVWHHGAITYAGSTISIYLDGVLIKVCTSMFLNTGTSYAKIGKAYSEAPPIFWDGLIDEVSIWNRALEPDEVESIYLYGICKLVEIDIKPGTEPPNPVNPDSKGLIPIAILTTVEFDATTVDPATIQIAGRGVAARGRVDDPKYMAHKEDVDGDGDVDLLVQAETYIEGASLTSGTVELTGTTFGGQSIVGYDEIIIVPPE